MLMNWLSHSVELRSLSKLAACQVAEISGASFDDEFSQGQFGLTSNSFDFVILSPDFVLVSLFRFLRVATIACYHSFRRVPFVLPTATADMLRNTTQRDLSSRFVYQNLSLSSWCNQSLMQ